MRSIGAAQYALDLLLQRVTDPAKKTFGKYLYEHGEYIYRGALRYPYFGAQVPSSRTLQSLGQK